MERDNPDAKGGQALATLRIRNTPSLAGQIIGRIQQGESALFLLDRMVFADGYLWTPLADDTGRYIAYASLNAQNHIDEYFLDTTDERQVMTEQEILQRIQRVSAILRHRNTFYPDTIFVHSKSDTAVPEPDPNHEVYNVDRTHPGRDMKYGLDLVDAMLSLFQMYPLPPIDDRATAYAEWGVSPDYPILFSPRDCKSAELKDALWEALEFASFLRFHMSKYHARYRNERKEWIESATTSAGTDIRIIASMIETMVSALGGDAPIPPLNEMPPDRRYSDYDRIAKYIVSVGRPAITVAVPSTEQPLPPQATTSELYTAASKSGDIDLADLLAPLAEKLVKWLIQAATDYLNNRTITQ